jgi:hypothetical protein
MIHPASQFVNKFGRGRAVLIVQSSLNFAAFKPSKYLMKKILFALFLASSIAATAQIDLPPASPSATLTTRIALTDVKISYSRPRIKGRKIFGAGDTFLTPYTKIWRTGANNGTVITFGDDVVVEGQKVPKGEYLLLTIPGATEWTVMLHKNVSIGGDTEAYKAENDAAKFVVKSEKLTEKVEMFTINVTDLSDDNTNAKIQLAWENTSVKFGVTVDFDSKVMASIDRGTKQVVPNTYIAAARYYYESKKDLKKALEWVDLGIANGEPNAFWNMYLKAQIQKAAGDKAGAKASAQKSLDMAKKADNDFGYIKQNEDLLKTL